MAVAGLAAWNSMSDKLKLFDHALSTNSFRPLIKTRLFSNSALESYYTLSVIYIYDLLTYLYLTLLGCNV